jgi:maleate cis-trans isomerase
VDSSKGSSVLGAILPDDGPFDYEWMHLDRWLGEHGFAGIDYRLVRSPADGVMAHTNLLTIGSADNLATPARTLADAGAGVIVWACTSGSFAGGRRFAEKQIESLSGATRLPATSTSIALVEAAKSIGATKVDLLSAYTQTLTETLVRFLGDSGLAVNEVRSLECLYTEQSFDVDIVHEVERFAADTRQSIHPILIPDTAINTLDLLNELTAAAGRPVITANQASLWHGLFLLDRASADAVRLFRH